MLLLGCFRRNKSHVRPRDRFTDRFGVGGIVLLPLHTGLNIGRWHQPHRVTRFLGRHQSLNVGSMHPPQTQGNVQSAVRLALSGMYLLQASALTGLIDCQMTSKVPEEFTLPIITGLEI